MPLDALVRVNATEKAMTRIYRCFDFRHRCLVASNKGIEKYLQKNLELIYFLK